MSIHYFSNKLRAKLKWISESSTVLVEAPSGYGKTTAVKDYLAQRKQEGAQVFWFTAMEETVSSAWDRLCNVIMKIDPSCGARLLHLGVPTNMTIGDISDELENMSCEKETYLVLDDFHLLDRSFSEAIHRAMFLHGGEQIHFVFIAQVFGLQTIRQAKRFGLNIITHEDLTLGAEDIKRFYELAGASGLTDQDALILSRKTGGWIIALCLQLKDYQETGVISTETTGDIIQLMQHLEWDDLSDEKRQFLLRICMFDSVTIQQILYLLDTSWMPKELWDFLHHSRFIRYEPQEERYFLHVILRSMLRKKFSIMAYDRRTQYLKRAGNWYESQRQFAEAAECYYQIRDWESLLKMPHVGLTCSKIGGTTYTQMILELLRDAPAELKAQYPISLMRFLYVLYAAGEFAEYDRLLNETREMIDQVPEPEHSWLLADWTVMSIYRMYPDLKKMTEVCREAKRLLNGRRTRVAVPEEPFAFACPSMWYMFHSCPGQGDAIGNQLEEFLEVYSSITRGRGMGADTVYRGELACMRGDFIRAEILAYKAADIGEKYNQITTCFGAALLIGRIALARKDSELFDYAVSYLEKKADFFEHIQPVQSIAGMKESILSILYSMQEKTSYSAEWAVKGEFAKGTTAIGSLMAGHMYITSLIMEKKYVQAIGIMEHMLSMDARICNFVTKNYIYLGLAVCYLAIGQKQEAVTSMKQALEHALPDGILLNLLRFAPVVEPLIVDPEHKKQYGELLEQVGKIQLGYAVDENSAFYLAKEKTEEKKVDALSDRERQVADLVAEGHSNREIAEILCISETTVKYHLRTIFSKMQIDRRSKLVKKLT